MDQGGECVVYSGSFEVAENTVMSRETVATRIKLISPSRQPQKNEGIWSRWKCVVTGRSVRGGGGGDFSFYYGG